MPIFDNFPYTDFHQLNLDWIIKTMKEQVQAIADDKQFIDDKVAEFQQDLDDFETAYNNLLALDSEMTVSGSNIIFTKNIVAPYFEGPAAELKTTSPTGNNMNNAIPDANNKLRLFTGYGIVNRPAAINASSRIFCMAVHIGTWSGTSYYLQIVNSTQDNIQYIRSGTETGGVFTWGNWAGSDHVALADSATYATSAGTATSADSATYATSAGTATSADSATYATSAGTATSATSAGVADNLPLITSVTSNNANDYYDGSRPIAIYHSAILSTNVPSAMAGSRALIFTLALDAGNLIQIAWFYAEGTNIYIRTRALNSWQAWKKFTLANV